MTKQYNKVLDDIAFLNLAARVCYSDSATTRDKQELYEQLLLVLEENTRARHWDYNKDTRNSRQRVENKKLIKENKNLKEEIRNLEGDRMNALYVKSKVLYVYMNKETNEFVDEDFNPTDNIFEATGYDNYDTAVKALENFDEPEDWTVVSKVITITIIDDKVSI